MTWHVFVLAQSCFFELECPSVGCFDERSPSLRTSMRITEVKPPNHAIAEVAVVIGFVAVKVTMATMAEFGLDLDSDSSFAEILELVMQFAVEADSPQVCHMASIAMSTTIAHTDSIVHMDRQLTLAESLACSCHSF